MIYRLMIALLLLSCGEGWAAEVCVDKGEFSQAMQRWQIDQKKIKVHEQKDVTQAQMLKERDAHIADQDKQLTACEKYKAAAEPLLSEYASQLEAFIKRTEDSEAKNAELEAKLAEQKRREWVEVAEIVGVTLLARGVGGKVWKWGKALIWK